MTARLKIRSLSAGYGRTSVLHGLDHGGVDGGRMVGLLGSNAAGKSTLLKVMAGLVRAEGETLFDGTNLADMPRTGRLAVTGYLPQTPPQSSRLLAWEVALAAFRAAAPATPRQQAEHRIQTMFARFELEEFALRPVSTLSGGKRQLLGLALVLARQVPLMLLDEPTSALDLRWQVQSLAAVREAVRRTGAVAMLALHDINQAVQFCDELIVLKQGRILASGPAERIVTPELLRETYGVTGQIETTPSGRRVVLIDDIAEQAAD